MEKLFSSLSKALILITSIGKKKKYKVLSYKENNRGINNTDVLILKRKRAIRGTVGEKQTEASVSGQEAKR